MVKSMTGFGKGEFADNKRNVLVEMKAVNHRYCDIQLKISRKYMFAEEKIKSQVKQLIKRGKIEVFITVESISDGDVSIKLNSLIAKQYMENLQELSSELGLKEEITLQYIAGLPDVMKPVADIDDEEGITFAILEALKIAIKNFDEMRQTEGEKLAEDIIHRGKLIREYVSDIEDKASKLQNKYAGKLRERIKELLDGTVEVPEDRIMVEAAVFADKANITEELVRLDSHIIQLNDIINKEKSAGKKLDFLVQEMNREANTIGAKANDLGITSTMLEIKSEVEKIREQIQNIE